MVGESSELRLLGFLIGLLRLVLESCYESSGSASKV